MDYDSILQVVGLLLTVSFVWKRVGDWRSFVRNHPALQYSHGSAIEAWRWATPPPELALQKLDTADYSRVTLPDARSTGQWVALACACAVMLGGGAMLFNELVLDRDRAHLADRLVIPVLTILFGGALLDYDMRLIAIDLKRDCAVFVLRYGAFLTRSVTVRTNGVHHFSGKVQSVLTQERGQRRPHFYLFLHRTIFARQFVTKCDPSQGSWIVGGLEHWRTVARGSNADV